MGVRSNRPLGGDSLKSWIVARAGVWCAGGAKGNDAGRIDGPQGPAAGQGPGPLQPPQRGVPAVRRRLQGADAAQPDPTRSAQAGPAGDAEQVPGSLGRNGRGAGVSAVRRAGVPEQTSTVSA
eukprot:670629-Pyramimonas_sp.AAC.1